MGELNETVLKEAVILLDNLLGVTARAPGRAAELPAVLRVIESLEPAGGMQFPIFPASYAGEGQKAAPVYDLNGVEYGPDIEVLHSKDRDRHKRQIIRARHCTVDSPQSQANRTEIAFLDDNELSALVPKATAKIPRAEGRKSEESVLRLPHRIADFRVRLSDKATEVKSAIEQFAKGDALKLLKMMPTSVVFGFWDSRGDGSQHKHARLLLSRIDAFNVIPCTKHAVYTGPYSKDEFAQVVLGDHRLAAESSEENETDEADTKAAATKKAFDIMAKRGFTAALGGGVLGGILVDGKIERLSLISLTDIARISCADDNDETRISITNAARRYIFALAALAESYPRESGSHRLRSGCELITVATSVELRGGNYNGGAEFLKVLANRKLLIEIAKEAKKLLKIPEALSDFVTTSDSLKDDFVAGGAKAKVQIPKKNSAKEKSSNT